MPGTVAAVVASDKRTLEAATGFATEKIVLMPAGAPATVSVTAPV